MSRKYVYMVAYLYHPNEKTGEGFGRSTCRMSQKITPKNLEQSLKDIEEMTANQIGVGRVVAMNVQYIGRE